MVRKIIMCLCRVSMLPSNCCSMIRHCYWKSFQSYSDIYAFSGYIPSFEMFHRGVWSAKLFKGNFRVVQWSAGHWAAFPRIKIYSSITCYVFHIENYTRNAKTWLQFIWAHRKHDYNRVSAIMIYLCEALFAVYLYQTITWQYLVSLEIHFQIIIYLKSLNNNRCPPNEPNMPLKFKCFHT